MSKTKIFNNMITNMLQNFNGQLMLEPEIKTKFTSGAGGIDCLLRVEKQVFLFVFKFDNGVMSVNNINLFFKSCNVVIDNIQKAHPAKGYTFYKILVTKKPVNFPDNKDQYGNPKFFNVHLNPEDLSDMIPESFEPELMDRVCMRLYNNIASTINQYPGIQEPSGDIRMTYSY